jgi:hypothetical protein
MYITPTRTGGASVRAGPSAGSAVASLLAVIAVDVRPGPSANVVLVTGAEPVLVDTGSASPASLAQVHAFLGEHGLAAGELAAASRGGDERIFR